jgi:hypothetical protein
MDQLVVANTSNNEVEEKIIPKLNDGKKSEGPKITHPRDMMTNSNKKKGKINDTMVKNGFKQCQHHTKSVVTLTLGLQLRQRLARV